MKIVVLMEDTCGRVQCKYEHGLSLYIETENHKILMDTGASDGILANAGLLKVALDKVDTVVLSHGHYDHSGGLLSFRKVNGEAAIYLQKTALAEYYHGSRYIGIDQRIGSLPGVVLLEGNRRIDGELSVFSKIKGRRFWPQSNVGLSVRVDGCDKQDSFDHEQCLVVEAEKRLLVSGCAHNGILNILDRYQEIYGNKPDVVISGFHMTKKEAYTPQEAEVILDTAKELAEKDILFYTGHCTGQMAIDLMKPVMGDRLIQLSCGMEIEV